MPVKSYNFIVRMFRYKILIGRTSIRSEPQALFYHCNVRCGDIHDLPNTIANLYKPNKMLSIYLCTIQPILL